MQQMEMDASLTRLDQLTKNINDMFLTSSGILICFMQCGFACLEAGSVRTKNVTNIMTKNLLDVFICVLGYWLTGYSLAYSTGNSFLGYSFWAGIGLPEDSLPHWFFQFAFAATASTIVSGAVAERCNFIAYIVYSAVISGFVYPVVTHWTWSSSGWLKTLGYTDFAGSGAVHLLGGTCSMVAAVILGPRIGRFQSLDRDIKEIPGHSTPFTGIGGIILTVGFLAFNGGSQGSITNPNDGTKVARAMINTMLGGSGSGLSVLLLNKLGITKRWSFEATLNAVLTGMVAVCAAANNLVFWGSFVSGVIAGFTFLLLHNIMLSSKIDDPVDAVAVHFGGGLWGLIAAPIFSNNGIVFIGNRKTAMTLAYNLAGAAAIIAWSGILSCIMFGALYFLGLFRVTPDQEQQGLDISMHGEVSYPSQGWQIKSKISTLPYKQHHRGSINTENGNASTTHTSQLQMSHFTNPVFDDPLVHTQHSAQM